MALFVSLCLLYTMLAADMRIRYIITIVTPMIVLSVFGLHQLYSWLRNKYHESSGRIVFVIMVASFFSYNILYGIKLFNKIDPIPFIIGDVSRKEYLAKYIPHYSLNQLANELVAKDKKLLGVYLGNRRYYFNVPVILNSEYIFTLTSQVHNSDELKQQLRENNISHILLRLDLFKNQLFYKNEREKNIIKDFFTNDVKLLKKEEVFGLYEIL